MQGALLAEITPERVRCTALAIGSNIAWSIVGGFVPLTATWLVWRSGNPLAPAWLVAGAAAMTFVAFIIDTSEEGSRHARTGPLGPTAGGNDTLFDLSAQST